MDQSSISRSASMSCSELYSVPKMREMRSR